MGLIYNSDVGPPTEGYWTFIVEQGVLLVKTDGISSISGQEINAKWFHDRQTITLRIAKTLPEQVLAEVTIETGLPVDDNLLKVELEEVAQHLGLSTSGTKAEIIDRIKQHLGIE
jgi:hypothetical protein